MFFASLYMGSIRSPSLLLLHNETFSLCKATGSLCKPFHIWHRQRKKGISQSYTITVFCYTRHYKNYLTVLDNSKGLINKIVRNYIKLILFLQNIFREINWWHFVMFNNNVVRKICLLLSLIRTIRAAKQFFSTIGLPVPVKRWSVLVSLPAFNASKVTRTV